MTNKMTTVSIGIPAYNEAVNIGHLLDDLGNQRDDSYCLERIIVVSDASTDNTEAIVKRRNDPRILCIRTKRRLGQALSQNKILARTTSDILVFLNADIRIDSADFLSQLIAPIKDGQADLTSCRVTPLAPRGMLERILFISTRMKESVYESLRGGNNVYTCHGRVRAFSKRFYSVFRFRPLAAEDAYSYLACIQRGFLYRYVKNTRVFYRLPGHLKDHARQSARFFQSVPQLKRHIAADRIAIEYAIPASIFVRALFAWTRRHPTEMVAYLMLAVIINIFSRWTNFAKPRWDISVSSKRLHIFISL